MKPPTWWLDCRRLAGSGPGRCIARRRAAGLAGEFGGVGVGLVDQAGDGQTQRCCGCACHVRALQRLTFLGSKLSAIRATSSARDHVDGRRGAVIDVADPADQVGADKAAQVGQAVDDADGRGRVAPPRKAVGSVHMMGEADDAGGGLDNAITASVRLVPAKTLATRPTAPSTRMKTRCQRRSRRRSELRPTSTMATMATRYGMALKRPMRTPPSAPAS